MAELLLEIGFEEMPAPWLADLGTQLASRFSDAAERERLEPKRADVQWTPRRLVLGAELLARQADREEPVWGPSLKVAKDAAGKWTGAAQGFAKKNGVSVDALRQAAKDPAKPDEQYLLHLKRRATFWSSLAMPKPPATGTQCSPSPMKCLPTLRRTPPSRWTSQTFWPAKATRPGHSRPTSPPLTRKAPPWRQTGRA